MLYPFLFEPNLHTVVWGGDQLRPYKGLEPSDEPIGESWEVSAVPSSTSIISNGAWKGRDLISVINEHPEAILGKAVNEKYHGQLPLLAKFIDAKRDLSIQVHPNDEMAQREHGKMGKSEMWYIIKADEGAHLYAGFKQSITPYEYQKRVEDGSITEVLADHQVKAGDVFYLPAAKALDYHVEKNYLTEYTEAKDQAIQIVDTPYFDVRIMELTRPFHRNLLKYDSFIISMCIEGDCKYRVRSTGDEITLREGSSTLIPASIADYDVIPLAGKSRILDAFIDNLDRSLSGQLARFFVRQLVTPAY